jgi:hypothetical protein
LFKILVDDGAADSFRIAYNNSEALNINTSRNVTVNVDIRAPIFYDSNNTGFYLDPASTSNLNVLNVATLNVSGGGVISTAYLPRMSDRDFANGTLVQTNINYAVTNGDPFVIEITGNSYGQLVPWDIQIQGYIYADTIINTAGISNGTGISGIRAINVGGNLCFWWPRQSYWNGFTVYVYVPYSTFQTNRVTSITDSVQPTTAKQVIFTVYQNYSNYNSTSYDATFNRLYSNTDMRAQLFYDTNDTSYYVDPHSTSYQRSLFLGAHDSGTSEFRFGEDSSGWYGDRWYWDSGYNTYRYSRFAGTDSLIHYHDTRDASRITYGRNIVFDNYGKGIVGTYDSYRLQAVFSMGDSYKLSVDGTSAGNLYGLAWSHPNAGSLGGANNLNDHGLLLINNGSFRAAISSRAVFSADVRGTLFYDYNNTGYYLDPTSTTALRTVGSWRSDSGAWDGDFSGKIQYHSNHWYIQAADLFIYRNAGGSNVFTINQSGSAVANADMRAPIFYDSNDTSYYTDPNSTSRLYSLTMQNTINFPTSSGASSGRGGPAYNIYQESGGWGFPYPDLCIAFHTGLSFGANPGYEGMRFFTDYDLGSRVMQVNGSSNYIYMDRWVNVSGNQGIYSGTNSAHFYPNGASYGSWKIDGSRNGWQGIEFQSGTTLMMNDDTYGFHRNSQGWRFYVTGGSGYFPGEVTAYWSDRRLKENIETLSLGEGTALINKLKPSRFNWRADLEEIAPNLKGSVKPGKEEVGLIAQEVQEVLPDAVKENLSGRSAGKGSSTESYLTVNYDRIVPFLIQAIQELTAKVASLEAQINEKN